MSDGISTSGGSELTKIDLRKQFKQLYNPPIKEAVLIDVLNMQFLMVDGVGNPNTAQEYKEVLEALYSVAYTLKFQIKKEQGIDYPVMTLEGLWWVDDMREFSIDKKDAWLWTMMIMQPEFVTVALFSSAVEQARKKKDIAALTKIRLEHYHEGLSAQIMHIGPYSAEGPTVKKLHAFIQEKGYNLRGKHHEIYLGDPRRAAPEKMKTVIRQPVV